MAHTPHSPRTPGAPAYRPDVDGLRALAVLAVVGFHYDLPGLGGGFVGVDVFFVISGYLITSLILRGLQGEGFSLRRFYERRVRRIFPALFVVLAATCAAGTIVLLPGELEALGRSTLATLGFASNILFWSQSGYFAAPALTKPLLHTWSLAVEEQFYIVFPPLIFAVCRWRRSSMPWTVLALAGVSFAFSVYQVGTDDAAAFFLPFGRAWEFLAGTWLVVSPWRDRELRSVRQVAGWAGLAAILAAAVSYDGRTDFPGHGALLPVLGAAALIWSGERGHPVTRALSTWPAVSIGLVSYSLYLWHWPVLVLARAWLVVPPTPLQTAGLVVLSFVLATATWRWVEQPFRRRRGAARAFAGAASAAAALGGAAAFLVLASGLPGRVPAEVNRLAAAAETVRQTDCFQRSAPEPGSACRLGESGDPDFVLWGDSHARAVVPGFDELAREHGLAGLAFGRGGCPPLASVGRGAREPCRRMAREAIEYLVAEPGLRTVVMAARWDLYLQGGALYGRAVSEEGEEAEGERGRFARALEATVRRLREAGLKVLLLGPVPEIPYDVPRALAASRFLNRHVELGPDRASFEARQAGVLAMLADLAARPGVSLVLPHAALCQSGTCHVIAGGEPLYFDDSHLSPTGARVVVQSLSPELIPRLVDEVPAGDGGRIAGSAEKP